MLKKLFAGLSCLFVAQLCVRAVTVNELRCEDLNDPQGIDIAQPRLSWILHSTAQGESQTAYQVLAASSPEALAADKGDMWDSGRVASSQSIQVDYAGKPLASRDQCFWKVRIWDQSGKASDWSKAALWTMGLLALADWGNAKWIGLDSKEVSEYLANTSWIWFPEGEPNKSAAAGTNYFRR